MHVIDFDEQYMGFVATCTHDLSNRLSPVAARRAAWIRASLKNGLKIKIAVEEGRPLGFAHSLPLELGTWEMEGRDVVAIPCLTLSYERVYQGQTGSGIGRALLAAVEADARQTAKGVVAVSFDHDFWFMPFAFFRKMGYREVARRGNKVMVLKAFAPVEPPRFVEWHYKADLCPGKVVVDAFWHDLCPTPIEEMQNIKQVCEELGERVVLRSINTSDPVQRATYPLVRALFINGVPVHFDDVGSVEVIREAILKALNGVQVG